MHMTTQQHIQRIQTHDEQVMAFIDRRVKDTARRDKLFALCEVRSAIKLNILKTWTHTQTTMNDAHTTFQSLLANEKETFRYLQLLSSATQVSKDYLKAQRQALTTELNKYADQIKPAELNSMQMDSMIIITTRIRIIDYILELKAH